MPSDAILDVRPRTMGEILDDAWRIYPADAPQLLLLAGLFHVPAFCAGLLLTTYAPAATPTWTDRLLQVCLTWACALLVPLTGVGSGACQEFLRRRAENRPVRVRDCLVAALRRGFEHSAARALMFLGVAFGLCLLLVPGCAVWLYGATVHALLADEKVLPRERWSQVGREAAFDAAKATGVVLTRLPLLFLAVVNLHVLVVIGLWAAGNLAGFNTSVLSFQLDPLHNGAYLLSLFLLAWLLLSPFHEASNFLLYLDTRVRQEGLDLLYQVQRVFATPERTKVVAGALGVVVAGLLLAAPAHAEPSRNETRLAAVRAARQEVDRIAEEVRVANPYTDGRRWEPRLAMVHDRLAAAWDRQADLPDPFAWFTDAVGDFGALDRQKAVGVLSDLQNRLSLLEDVLAPAEKTQSGANGRPKPTRDEVKKLVHRRDSEDKPSTPKEDDPHKDEVKHVEVKRDGPEGGPAARPAGGVITPGVGGAGLGETGLTVLLVLFVGVMVAALVLLGVHLYRTWSRRLKQPKTETKDLPEEAEPSPTEQPAAVLWQQAEKLAQEGRYLDALRMLYRAVLSLLHRKQLLRYESTRTNGEYVQEVRLSPQARAELREPFERLTDLFERKWYGDGVCEPAEFQEGHGLAEEIQGMVR
jgi:hypothetical protein